MFDNTPNYNNVVNPFEMAHVWYKDAPKDSSNVPLEEWDLVGFGKGVLNYTGEVHFTKGPRGVASFDDRVYEGQTIVEQNTGTLTCANPSFG